MKIYTVFLPAGLAPAQAMERVKFVKQGFDWAAFLVTPFWAVRHKLWLALALWIAALAAIGLISALAHLNSAAVLLLYIVLALAFGLESDRLKQNRLFNAGFLLHGLTLGANLREAEAIYFAKRSGEFSELNRASANGGRPGPSFKFAAGDPDLLGLFPSRESRF